MGYIAEIFEKLKNKGVHYFDEILTEHKLELEHVTKLLQYVPAETQEKILQYLDENGIRRSSLDGHMQELSEKGILSFKPYVTKHEGGRPILVLKYNRYMMLKKDKGFVVCYRPDGSLEYQTTSNNLGAINECFENVDLMFCKLHQILIYMNAFEAGRGIEAFDRLCISTASSGVVDRFVSAAVRYAYGFENFSVKYTQLYDYLTVTDKADVNVSADKVFRIAESKTRDFARLYLLHDFKIAVEVLSAGTPRFIIMGLPNPVEDMKALVESRDIDILDLENIYTKACIRTQFATYVLNALGYIVNHNICYKKFDLFKSVRRLNDPSVENIESIDTLMNYFYSCSES